MAPGKGIAAALDELERLYGRPRKPVPKTPLEWILWENVAYLVDDERRELAFRALGKKAGWTADRIAKASRPALLEATRLGGMHPEQRVERLKDVAELALAEGSADLSHLRRLPPAQARKVLKKFPGIGDPGADKILLFCGFEDVLALDSNALRAAVRLGYGEEAKSYASTYRSALAALAPGLGRDPAVLRRASQLLRIHGQGLCKRNAPDCDDCPLSSRCRYYAREAVGSPRTRG
jgi:endonuclease-3